MVQVLVADDDRTYRLILAKMLKSLEVEIVEATNGAEALEILQGLQPPPIAVLDWMMPELEGVEVCRRVRADQSDEKRPYLIIMTAQDGNEAVEQALSSGADDYLRKPFQSAELKTRFALARRITELESSVLRKNQQLKQVLTMLDKRTDESTGE